MCERPDRGGADDYDALIRWSPPIDLIHLGLGRTVTPHAAANTDARGATTLRGN
jgi:hypothetical protein